MWTTKMLPWMKTYVCEDSLCYRLEVCTGFAESFQIQLSNVVKRSDTEELQKKILHDYLQFSYDDRHIVVRVAKIHVR